MIVLSFGPPMPLVKDLAHHAVFSVTICSANLSCPPLFVGLGAMSANSALALSVPFLLPVASTSQWLPIALLVVSSPPVLPVRLFTVLFSPLSLLVLV